MSGGGWPVDPFGAGLEEPTRAGWPLDPFGHENEEPAENQWPTNPFATENGDAAAVRPWRGREGRRQGRQERADLSTLARGGTLSLVGSVASSVLGFVLVVVITRGLTRTAAGVFLEAIAMFIILSNTVELGADTALVRMVARYASLGRTQDIRPTIRVAMWPVLIAGSLASVAVYIWAPQLASVFIRRADPHSAELYIRAMAPFLPLAGATTVALSGTRGFGTMLPYVAIQSIAVPIARPIMVLIAIGAGAGTLSIALAWSVPVGVGFLGSVIALLALDRRAMRRHGLVSSEPPRPSRVLASEFWRFAAPRGLAGILQIAVIWLDILLVGALRSAREAAVYTAASRFTGVGTFALQAIGLAIAPQISSLLAARKEQRAESVFQTATWWLMVASWPIYLALAIFAPFLMRVFGHDYTAGATSLMILSLAMLALVGTGNNKVVLLMGGGSGWNLGITAASLTSNIALNLILIPHHGINGAAIAFAVSIVGDNVATTLVVLFRMKLQPFGRGYVIAGLASLFCYGAVGLSIRLALGMSAGTFLLYGVAGTALYLPILWRFRGLLQLAVFRDLVRARRRRMQGSTA